MPAPVTDFVRGFRGTSRSKHRNFAHAREIFQPAASAPDLPPSDVSAARAGYTHWPEA
jgi:hypothetical protein